MAISELSLLKVDFVNIKWRIWKALSIFILRERNNFIQVEMDFTVGKALVDQSSNGTQSKKSRSFTCLILRTPSIWLTQKLANCKRYSCSAYSTQMTKTC
jgi:hypothetical protein